ncbi:Tetratricopeptide TPR_2 repeat protein [Magnetococcus marinus MC-1]|uniref:Tetratricopeptide TPR_2 repeat protein n=1 Tax=Magnetococcus marinus (strain ATCC BAA-1437 / JCM 17883 / MC-1) TaxID=156889 RepID=A0LDJ4_MAGMM|nr:sulfotransferase [Magnetococcus marinus]ABK46037.1 Tetratricopeptide TPR_2 repeat protein [Magnetococcus marinus MC-1]
MISSPATQRLKLLQDAQEHLLRGRLPTAWNILDRALRSTPGDAAILSLMAQIQRQRGDLPLSEKLARMAIAAHPEDGQGHLALGHTLAKQGRSSEAEKCWQQAAILDPTNPEPHLSMAQLAEQEKRYIEAESAADRALSLKPDHLQATMIRARCDAMRNQPDQGAKRLLKLSTASMLPAQRVDYYFELGHLQQDARRYQQAFESYSEANRLQHLTAQPSESPRAEQLIPQLAQWSAALPPPNPTPIAAPGKQPVFIMGYPRSGFTLLSQMLAAHPRLVVMSGYRLPSSLVERLAPHSYPSGLAQLDPPTLAAMRQLYFKHVQRIIGALPAPATLVDMHPLHILDLPMIQRLFPHAAIIHLTRHPMDAALQCFIRHTHAHDPATVMVRSLHEAVALYVAMMNLLNASLRLQPATLHTLRYESIVENMPMAVQTLLTRLNIPWDDAIHRYRGVPMRRLFNAQGSLPEAPPLHSRQVALWPVFHSYLRPFIPLLDPYAHYLGFTKPSTVAPRR